MGYTNTGLVEHAKLALRLKTKYMWGGILRPITDNYVNQLSGIPAYKTHYPNSRVAMLKALPDGYFGVDCVGLIKSYYWSGKDNGGTGSPNYGKAGFPDVNAHGMYNAAKVKGKINTMPEIAGLIVYSKTHPHVGVYIGNGYVIESTLSARGDGVVKTKLSAWKGWEYWFKCPYISYPKASTTTALKAGDTVRVIGGAPDYNGKALASFVYKQKYTVMQVKGDRVVIGQKGAVTAAINKKYLSKA